MQKVCHVVGKGRRPFPPENLAADLLFDTTKGDVVTRPPKKLIQSERRRVGWWEGVEPPGSEASLHV